jgi:CRISPR-associated endonuclease/helicase Cas3
MKITIVDRSEKAALRKTRQVLCCYLDRVGSETYVGEISLDGLSELKKTLLSTGSITKLASISCYLHRDGRLPELMWTLGSKRKISDDGMYAHKTKGVKSKKTAIKSPVMEYLMLAVRMAGLFHDLGKGTIGFSEKLRRAVENPADYAGMRDPIRHELVSLLLLDFEDPEDIFNRFLRMKNVGDIFEGMAKHISSSDSLKEISGLVNQSASLSTKPGSDPCDFELDVFSKKLRINQEQSWSKNPFWMGVMWLVLTHHKLPTGFWSERNDAFTATLTNHIGRKFDAGEVSVANISRLPDFLKMCPTDQPWQHREWVTSVSRCAKKLKELREEYPDFEKKMFEGFSSSTNWTKTLFRVGRFCLVSADYEASCDDSKEEWKYSIEGKVFANTKFVDGQAVMADPLHVHLNKVGRFAPEILHRLFISRDSDFFRPVKLDQHEIPFRLKPASVIEAGRFEWQGHAQKAISELRHSDAGFFGVVAAGTGRGKTLACASFMANFRKNPRFTVALSLRSLTTQTANAYVGEGIGLHPDSVAMFVGDDLAKRKFSRNKHEIKRKLRSPGTDNVINPEDEEGYPILFKGVESAALGLKSLSEDKYLKKLLSAPVTVMTVDHIMRLVDLAKSNDIIQILHLLETDLILDEIDDYKNLDMIAVGRLIELFAQFGRRVIIASATLPGEVVSNLRRAYLSGYAIYQEIHGTEDAQTSVITHVAPYYNLFDGADFNSYYDGVMSHFCAEEKKMAIDAGRRGTRVLSGMAASFPNMASYAVGFAGMGYSLFSDRKEAEFNYFNNVNLHSFMIHRENKMTDDETGISYSAGFLRFNSVAIAQRYMRWCEENIKSKQNKLANKFEKDGVEFKFVCYHAQNLEMIRGRQEEFFEKSLNRSCMNDGGRDPLLDNKYFRDALDTAKQESKKHVILVVVTSPLMEVGRDYDFDWCILEPDSTTSIVQAGGRVRRHRTSPMPGKYNVGILEYPVRALYEKKEFTSWTKLGNPAFYPSAKPSVHAMTCFNYLGVHGEAEIAHGAHSATEAFPRELVGGILHAGFCLENPLSYDRGPLTLMERAMQASTLVEELARGVPGSAPWKCLEFSLNHHDAGMTSGFYEKTRFRGKNNSTKIMISGEHDLWYQELSNGDVRDLSTEIDENFPQEPRSLYLLGDIEFQDKGSVIQAAKHKAKMAGYADDQMEICLHNLLSAQRDLAESLMFDPQIGFFSY